MPTNQKLEHVELGMGNGAYRVYGKEIESVCVRLKDTEGELTLIKIFQVGDRIIVSTYDDREALEVHPVHDAFEPVTSNAVVLRIRNLVPKTKSVSEGFIDMNILIVEDDPERIKSFKRRLRNHNVTVVHQSRDGISRLRAGDVDMLFLDHDLDGTGMPQEPGLKTGYEVAAWLAKNDRFIPDKVYVHSKNPRGRAAILRVLDSAVAWPYAWEKV